MHILPRSWVLSATYITRGHPTKEEQHSHPTVSTAQGRPPYFMPSSVGPKTIHLISRVSSRLSSRAEGVEMSDVLLLQIPVLGAQIPHVPAAEVADGMVRAGYCPSLAAIPCPAALDPPT